MASIVHRLAKKALCSPPTWLPDNVHYETQMGSVAYGVSSDDSDIDVYGFCIPKKMLFSHIFKERSWVSGVKLKDLINGKNIIF